MISILKKPIIATIAATILVAGIFAFMPVQKAASDDDDDDKQLISESALLNGLAAGVLFPFIDTTPNKIVRAHIALTDTTAVCDGDNANQPLNIVILAGQAGVSLVPVTMDNTGIASGDVCVFHKTIKAGSGGIPSKVTDIVVVNVGSDLTGINTVTVTAEVRT